MKEEKGFYLEFVDVFPWCIVKPEYRYLLREGGCNWGTDYCAVFQMVQYQDAQCQKINFQKM